MTIRRKASPLLQLATQPSRESLSPMRTERLHRLLRRSRHPTSCEEGGRSRTCVPFFLTTTRMSDHMCMLRAQNNNHSSCFEELKALLKRFGDYGEDMYEETEHDVQEGIWPVSECGLALAFMSIFSLLRFLCKIPLRGAYIMFGLYITTTQSTLSYQVFDC